MSEATRLAAGRVFPNVSPVVGESVGEYPAMTAEDAVRVASTVAAAQKDWSTQPFTYRRRILLNAADALEASAEDYVQEMALEIGATRPWAEMNIVESAATLREAAGLASAPIGELLPSSVPNTVNQSLRAPAGVSLSIVPWNAPVILSARSSAISLAIGNGVVIRPSEEAPRSAGHLLRAALVSGGMPEDVLQVVTTAPGDGRNVVEALISTPEIRRVAFIGSTPVGRSIAAHAGRMLKPSVMELGGKNVTVVREDADLERWTPALGFSAFVNTGQVCMCTDTVLVHRSRYDELVQRLEAIAKSMKVGDPRDGDTDVGPLINWRALDHFRVLVEDAQAHGAEVVAGGRVDGLWAWPTVLTGIDETCRFATEEGFAPIVSVEAYDTDEAAVKRANIGEVGLIASVISSDHTAALNMARRIRAGAVHVNGASVGDEPHVPFGGLGASGMGRLGGAESVHFFTEQRTLYIHDQMGPNV